MTATERARPVEQALAALAVHAPDIARRAESDVPSPATFDDLRRAGLPSFIVPASFGGGGAGLTEASAVVRSLASSDASAALVLAMHYIHSTRLLSVPDPSDHTAALARKLATTDGLLNYVSSERLSGAPSRGGPIQTTARLEPDGSWLLTGRKRYVTGSIALDYLLVSAAVEQTPGANPTVRTFIVPTDARGLVIEDTWDTIGLRGSASNDVVLYSVRVPAEAIAQAYDPEPPVDLSHAFGTWWAVILASVHLGIAEAARAVALEFALGARTDGTPGLRAEQPRTVEHAARIDLALLQARTLLDDILRRSRTSLGPGEAVQAAATKLLVHQHSSEAVDHACRLVGGASVWNTSPLGRHFRDLRVAQFNPPNEDVVVDLVGRTALGISAGWTAAPVAQART